MQQLTPAGQQIIDDIARRYGYSTDAVLSMLQAVVRGNGSMAQFNHPEFSGAGQWMRGGMTMVSDMFNSDLQASVNTLCSELSQLLAAQPDLLRSRGSQSQSQGGRQYEGPHAGSHEEWWRMDLGWPNSTGAQDGIRYAYFAHARRLAIEVNGRVTVYDTLDHRIGGFSQQQSQGGSLGFSSQHGPVDVARLPVVAIDGVTQTASPKQAAPAPQQANTEPAGGADIFAMIDKLAELRSRNILTEAEFAAKKAELLARL